MTQIRFRGRRPDCLPLSRRYPAPPASRLFRCPAFRLPPGRLLRYDL